MAMVKVLLGSFTFLEPQDNENNVYQAIVHRVDNEIEVSETELDEFCEKSLETYEGYLIPSMYHGVIQYNT